MKKNQVLGAVVLALLFLCLPGCFQQQAIITVHNKMVVIESTMVDRYNEAEDAGVQAAALGSGVSQMEAIDTSSCPPDYQQAWQNVIQLWGEIKQALEDGDIPTADRLSEQSQAATQRLNEIARSHGVTITDP